MADPLSVAASVVGLLATAGEMAKLLRKLTALADAPASARAVLTELTDMSAALSHLQDYRCVITSSELEVIVNGVRVDPEMGFFDRVKWSIKEHQIKDIVQRIQNHKSSLTLILNILQCKSNQEAENSITRLCALVEQVVISNQDLSARLRRLERGQSHFSLDSGNPRSVLEDDALTIRPQVGHQTGHDVIPSSTDTIGFAFDPILQTSRVYSNCRFRHSQSSLTSSARQTVARSSFSSLSLSDISNISVFSLPIYAIDITNSKWYTFGPSFSIPSHVQQTPSSILTPATPPTHFGALLPRHDNGTYFEVEVKTLSSELIWVLVSSGDTCKDLKNKIEDKTYHSAHLQYLVFQNK